MAEGKKFAVGDVVEVVSHFSRSVIPGEWKITSFNKSGTCATVRDKEAGKVKLVAFTRLKAVA